MVSLFFNTIGGRRVVRDVILASVAFALISNSPQVSAQVETGAIEKTVPTEPVAVKRAAASEKKEKEMPEDRIRPIATKSSVDSRPTDPAMKFDEKPGEKPPALGASIDTRTEARTFTLLVPSPRGQILDRKGRPLAQNKIAWYAAVNFPQLADATDTQILQYAGERIVKVNQVLGSRWDLPAKTVLEHYKNRRWLPLSFSDALSEEEAEALRKEEIQGLMLQPVYLRHYPRGPFLSHVLGYVGKRPPRSTGVIGRDEPLWGEGSGAEGLEEQFDQYLKGAPGKVTMLFESDGTKLKEETVRRPTPGQNLVTSIDAEMQELAERLLAEKTHRGAFVVMDVRTGDILVMASWPMFDPNDFIPAITQEKFNVLNNDPEKPLFPRAFRGAYPPASTFKIPVALAALETRTVSEQSLYNCPTSWWIGNVEMHNWNKDPEGEMNVIGAIARSCNTWFYEVGTMTGSEGVTGMARRLGFGEKTGIPLKAEVEGIMPTDRWWYDRYGNYMSDGDLANICIGQGAVEASPLQVARMMAAVGNRRSVLKPRLVKQVQDYSNKVVATFPVEERSDLNIDPHYLDVVRQGMKDVVNSGRGTGRSAGNSKIVVAGKTGTGQWKPAYEQNIAWFAGFAPADAPVLAFAVLYEGNPGEKVGGSRNAAPIIGAFLKEYLDDEENLAEVQAASDEVLTELARAEPVRARPVVESIFREGEVAEDYENEEVRKDMRGGSGEDSALSRWFQRFRRR